MQGCVHGQERPGEGPNLSLLTDFEAVGKQQLKGRSLDCSSVEGMPHTQADPSANVGRLIGAKHLSKSQICHQLTTKLTET